MSRGLALELKEQIWDRIGSKPDAVWTSVDFADLGSRVAIYKGLQRLVKGGQINRIDRGLYFFARKNSLTGKPAHPDQRAVIDAIAQRDQSRIVVDGLTAANDLGFTTAVPARVVVMTDARLQPIRLGNQTIEFKTVAPSRLYWAGHPAMRVVQALHWVKDMLQSDPSPVQERLRMLLNDPKQGASLRADLEEGIHTLPIWMQDFIRPLIGVSRQPTAKSKADLAKGTRLE